MYICAALYKFVELNDYEQIREPLYQTLIDNDVKGTLLLAREGINGYYFAVPAKPSITS